VRWHDGDGAAVTITDRLTVPPRAHVLVFGEVA
jgi:hypothetical protein